MIERPALRTFIAGIIYLITVIVYVPSLLLRTTCIAVYKPRCCMYLRYGEATAVIKTIVASLFKDG